MWKEATKSPPNEDKASHDRALQQDPDNLHALRQSAIHCFNMGCYSNAVALFSHYIDLHSSENDYELFYAYCTALHEVDRYTKQPLGDSNSCQVKERMLAFYVLRHCLPER